MITALLLLIILFCSIEILGDSFACFIAENSFRLGFYKLKRYELMTSLVNFWLIKRVNR